MKDIIMDSEDVMGYILDAENGNSSPCTVDAVPPFTRNQSSSASVSSQTSCGKKYENTFDQESITGQSLTLSDKGIKRGHSSSSSFSTRSSHSQKFDEEKPHASYEKADNLVKLHLKYSKETEAGIHEEAPISPEDLLLAATYVEDAKRGRRYDFSTTERDVRLYHLYNRPVFKFLLYFFMALYMSLAVFEDPSTFSWKIPYWIPMVAEFVCVVYFTFRFVHFASFMEPVRFWSDRKNIAILLLILLSVIDMACYIAFVELGFHMIRWSRPLRPLFMVNFPEGRNIRRAFRNIRRTLPDISNVLFLFFFSVTIFALMALKLYGSRNLQMANGESYFQTFWDSFFDLYVLVTTANNPDLMMPAYDNNPWFSLFFVAYLVICLYIFMSIFLAVVYNNYRKHLKNEVRTAVYMKLQQLVKAYDILKVKVRGMYGITKIRFSLLIRALAPERSGMYADILWRVLDTENKNYLVKHEFLKLSDLLTVEMSEVKDRKNFCDVYCSLCYNSCTSRIVRRGIRHRYFRYFFDALIVLNAFFIAFDQNMAEWFFLISFTLEIIMKMYAFGVQQFFARLWNLFDFVVIGSALFLAVVELIENNVAESRIVLDVLLVLRVLRLVKIIGSFKRFKVIVTTIRNLGPSMITYGGVLFVFYYIFAIIGMEVFQGLVQPSNYNFSDSSQLYCGNHRLNNTDFWRNHYCSNNFNNFLSSLVVLFELTVVNQWHVITDGYVKVTSNWARIYFFSFHIICVIIIMNIFTAFVLEAFILEFSLSQGKIECELETKINEMGLGLGSKPRHSVKKLPHSTDKVELVMDVDDDVLDDDEDDLVDADHDFRQFSTDFLPIRGTFPNLSEDTDIRFHLTKSVRNVEVLLQRMFETELNMDEIGPELKEDMEQPRQRRLTLDNVT